MTIETIDRATYEHERAICDRATAVLESLWVDHAKGGAIPAVVTSHPDWKACDNEMRGRVEQFELLNDPPECFVAYIDKDHAATTWTGLKLSTRGVCTGMWRVNSWMGSHMAQYRFIIAGREYTGRGFGEGMYIRLKETAASKRKREGETV